MCIMIGEKAGMREDVILTSTKQNTGAERTSA
jgi:hypothetical protein